MSVYRKWILNLLLVVAGTVLGIGLIEAALRYVDWRGGLDVNSLTRTEVVDLPALNYNSEPVSRHKILPNQFRALSFGDSYAYTIVQHAFTYHSIAAKAASSQTGKPVEVVNLGEPAISFYQYMKAYRVFGPAIDHDAVIFNVYLGNDLLDVAYGFVPDDVKINRVFGSLKIDLQTGETRRVGIPKKFPLRVMDYGFAFYLARTGKIQPVAKRERMPPYNFAVAELKEDAWLDNLNTQLDNFDREKLPALRDGYVAAVQFARFVRDIAASGKRVLIVLSPNQEQVDADVLDKVLRKFGRNANKFDLDLSAQLLSKVFRDVAPDASVVYLRPALSCAAREGVHCYYKTDTHWSAEGNRLVGELLGAWISEHWLSARLPGQPDCLRRYQLGTDADAEGIYLSSIKSLLSSAPNEGRIK